MNSYNFLVILRLKIKGLIFHFNNYMILFTFNVLVVTSKLVDSFEQDSYSDERVAISIIGLTIVLAE